MTGTVLGVPQYASLISPVVDILGTTSMVPIFMLIRVRVTSLVDLDFGLEPSLVLQVDLLGLASKEQASKQARVKWAKQTGSLLCFGFGPNFGVLVDDAYGCEGQAHKVWARNSRAHGNGQNLPIRALPLASGYVLVPPPYINPVGAQQDAEGAQQEASTVGAVEDAKAIVR